MEKEVLVEIQCGKGEHPEDERIGSGIWRQLLELMPVAFAEYLAPLLLGVMGACMALSVRRAWYVIARAALTVCHSQGCFCGSGSHARVAAQAYGHRRASGSKPKEQN